MALTSPEAEWVLPHRIIWVSERVRAVVGSDLKSWFETFKGQSADPESLGELRMLKPRELGGGKSGASAAFFMPTKGAIVLKWDRLDAILNESEVRKARWRRDLAENPSRDHLQVLRSRGASHIAIAEHGTEKSLIGIMAYPYLGPTDSQGHVGDFEWLIRKKYISGDFDILQAFQLLLGLGQFEQFPIADGQVPQGTMTINLPDLARWDDFYDAASTLAVGTSTKRTLRDLSDWLDTVIGRQHLPSAPDSRVLHGDPRLSNIMIDTGAGHHTVDLIDYGAGNPEGGGHIFRDLARFEVDLLFRASPAQGRRAAEIAERARLLFQLGQPNDDPNRARNLQVAVRWRTALEQRFDRITKREVHELHAVFIAMELLRRLKWHQELSKNADSGARVPELFKALDVLMEVVPK